MRKIICLVLAVFVFATYGSAHAERFQHENEQIALQVVKGYFDALIVGDVAGVRSPLGGALLKERSAMLNNPSYGAFLQDLYASASYQIIQVATVDDSTVAVQVRLNFEDGNSQDSYFLLDKQADNQYKIVAEN